MNINDEVARQRLFRAISASYKSLEPFRKLNQALVAEYAGSGYGQDSKPKYETVLNLMNQTVDAYSMALAANRPRVLLSAEDPSLTAFAKTFGVAMNNLLSEIGLEYVLRQQVLDAFFCVGIVKVHLADSGMVQLERDRFADPGRPFASNVSLDNWVHDMAATRFSQVRFAGDMYRIPFSDLTQPMYDQSAAEGLVPTSKGAADQDRLEKITKGEEIDQDELEPMLFVADVWIPEDGKIYTFAVSDPATFLLKGKPLAALTWDASEHGCYHLLGFNDIPENIMPASPAGQLSAMARLINNLMRKQSRRARGQKKVHTYTPAGKNDARKIKDATDDEFIEVLENSEVGERNVGGVDPLTQTFILGTMEMFDRMAGNLTAMLGLGAQADTASQESMIHQAASKKEAQMQYRTLDSATRIVQALGLMLWQDRAKTIPGRYPIEGAEGYHADATWSPDYRVGRFFDYKLSVDVFSMAYQSPSQRVQAINQLISQTYAPLAQLLQQQGGQINLQRLTDLYAELLNLPQLKEVVQFVNVLPEQGGGEESGGMPSATTRSYVRRNVAAGPSAQARGNQQQQQWLAHAESGDGVAA